MIPEPDRVGGGPGRVLAPCVPWLPAGRVCRARIFSRVFFFRVRRLLYETFETIYPTLLLCCTAVCVPVCYGRGVRIFFFLALHEVRLLFLMTGLLEGRREELIAEIAGTPLMLVHYMRYYFVVQTRPRDLTDRPLATQSARGVRCLSVCPSVFLSVCLSVWLPGCLFGSRASSRGLLRPVW